MYCDVLGLVTTGMGNLIDGSKEMTSGWSGDPTNPAPALGLPWLRKDGTAATQAEILTEWHRVKAVGGDKALQYWPSTAMLHLSDDAVASLVYSKLAEFATALAARPSFSELKTWPADAQLGLLSMAWAMGAGFNFPNFEAACSQRAFGRYLPDGVSIDPSTAAGQCKMSEIGNPGLVPRNKANAYLFLAAGCIELGNLDPEILIGYRIPATANA